MFRLLLTASTTCILAGIFSPSPTFAADEKPLPKKVEFELNVWQARLGLKKIHMRELRFAAGESVARIKVVMEDEEAQEDLFVTLQAFQTEEEPWASISLPRALRDKKFTKVAEAVLSEKQIAGLVAFKKHARQLNAESKQKSRIHARLAALTKEFYLTETQRTKMLELLTTGKEARRKAAKKFKGREDEIPAVKPLRQTAEFRAILDANQLTLLEKKAED